MIVTRYIGRFRDDGRAADDEGPVGAKSFHQPAIGKTVDDAMVAIERDNPRLKGVLPKDYARPGLDKHRLGELIDLIATISPTAASEGEKTHRSFDLLGREYEYFLRATRPSTQPKPSP